jgi:hypothetical protein
MTEMDSLEICFDFYFGFFLTNLRLHIDYFSRILLDFPQFLGECSDSTPNLQTESCLRVFRLPPGVAEVFAVLDSNALLVGT